MTRLKLLLVLLAVTVLTGCHEDNDNVPAIPNPETITLNIDVVLPADIRAQWQNSIDWAQQNMAKAQQRQQRQVRLNLRYHDEDTENLEQLAYDLANPAPGNDTCHAIIGPYHSDNAMTFLQHAARNRMPVVMPTCTSAELQRINARNTYAWFLTESDITQCEMMVSSLKTMEATDVVLIYADDTYGHSFNDWFGYYATERGIHIAGSGSLAYHEGEDLRPFYREIIEGAEGEEVWVMLALNSPEDYLTVMNEMQHYWFYESLEDDDRTVYMRYICADTSLDKLFLDGSEGIGFKGITPYASKSYGFPQAYEGRFSRLPFNGEAQIYDALTIIAMGAACRAANPDHCIVDGKEVAYKESPYGPGLTDYMRAVVSSDSGANGQWDANGLASAFSALAEGKTVNITGATGSLLFDAESRTKILNTTYMLWQKEYMFQKEDSSYTPAVKPILHLSTAGSSSEASTTAFWELEKKWNPQFDNTAVQHHLPPTADRWAVVISPSTTWANYRHQADALAMYQLLRQNGYDDEHIVLIAEDNLAYDSKNVYPGQIFIERSSAPGESFGNEDVRQGAVVDYRFSDLRREDIADILMGQTSSRLPHVIHPDSASNVFIFWSGHGGSSEGPLWGNEDAREYFGIENIRNTITRMSAIAADHGPVNAQPRMYRRMMLAVEACYSGKWGEALTGLPDVLVLTAANSQETSKADVFDQQLGVYLSNAFSRTFRSMVGSRSDITIYDLYRELYRTTTGSHVTIYNNQQYGSVYTETMQDFFPGRN